MNQSYEVGLKLTMIIVIYILAVKQINTLFINKVT